MAGWGWGSPCGCPGLVCCRVDTRNSAAGRCSQPHHYQGCAPELPHLWAGLGRQGAGEPSWGLRQGSSLGWQPGQLGYGGARPGAGDGAPGHLLDALCAVVLVVHVARHVLEVMHVCADEHVSQLHEVAVRLVLHCGAGACSGWGASQGSAFPPSTLCLMPGLTLHDPPGVQSPPDSLPLGLHHRVAANYREGRTLLQRDRCKGSRPVRMG